MKRLRPIHWFTMNRFVLTLNASVLAYAVLVHSDMNSLVTWYSAAISALIGVSLWMLGYAAGQRRAGEQWFGMSHTMFIAVPKWSMGGRDRPTEEDLRATLAMFGKMAHDAGLLHDEQSPATESEKPA